MLYALKFTDDKNIACDRAIFDFGTYNIFYVMYHQSYYMGTCSIICNPAVLHF